MDFFAMDLGQMGTIGEGREAMHELALAQGMLDIATEELSRHNCKRLTLLRVNVGAMSGVVPECLDFAFSSLVQGWFVVKTSIVDRLLREFLHSRVHLFAVLDEYGGLAGVVTLEDVMEEILGREIVDESDSVADLQTLARQRRKTAAEERKA